MRTPPAVEPLRIRTVVVPLDGSAFAEQALPWAIAVAAKARAKLRLVLVHRLPPSPPLDETTAKLYTRVELATRSAERDYLRRQATRIKAEHRVQAVTAMLEGAPAEALERYLDEMGADLVVMTTHGRGGLQRAWLGSVADRLVRSLDAPVLLVRPSESAPTGAPQMREILVPLDGSRRAEAALGPALAMAKVFDASLALLQAVYPVPLVIDPPTSYPTEIDQELSAVQRRQAQDYLDGLAERLAAGGVRTTGAAVTGPSAFEAIEAAARAPGIGMVALATHGRGGMRRLVLGSVADKLVRAGRLPVLVTRSRGR